MGKSSSKHPNKKMNIWPIKAALITLLLAVGFSFVSELLLRNANLPVALFVLFVIIFIGIVADVIGIASTSGSAGPFSAMAAKKIWGAKQAQKLVNNSSMVSSICNDVVGDVCGIISGASGAAITLKAFSTGEDLLVSIVISALIAATTVGGKALGKKYAVDQSVSIILSTGRMIAFFSGDFKHEKASKNVDS